jgi:hypothetical protein
MFVSEDFSTGFEDATLAIRHLLSMTSEKIELNDVLEYIYKNFGTRRYRESQDYYLMGVQKAFHESLSFPPGLKSESPAIQEGNIESGANSYNY